MWLMDRVEGTTEQHVHTWQRARQLVPCHTSCHAHLWHSPLPGLLKLKQLPVRLRRQQAARKVQAHRRLI